jgi:hypothetical protein
VLNWARAATIARTHAHGASPQSRAGRPRPRMPVLLAAPRLLPSASDTVPYVPLQDHNSSTPLSEHIPDWISSGVVVYTRFAGQQLSGGRKKQFSSTGQGYGYQDCLARARGRHTWLAFLDSDEFLVLTGASRNIGQLLREYETFGGLAVNWRMFGSSGHRARPGLPTLQAYTRSIPDHLPSDNMHVKAIVNVRFAAAPGTNPHTFRYRRGWFAVTEGRRRCGGALCAPVSVARIAVHHYALKSEEDFREKMGRGSAVAGAGGGKQMEFFHRVDNISTADNLDGLAAFAACCAHLPQHPQGHLGADAVGG